MRRFIAALVVGVVVGGTLLAAPASAATVAVAAKDFAFNPPEIQVQTGDTVTWTNGDPEPHTVTADDGSFSMLINPGESASHTFTTDGTVPYYCKLHGAPGGEGMAGVVQVGTIEPVATIRLTATDNVGRAIAWSKTTYPDGADFALLGRADGFADSLSTGAAQGKLGAPLLLTGSGGLDARVKTELARLKVRVVYLFGGTGALSSAVANELQAAGYTVRRIAGADRLGTATAAAETFLPEATSAILVRGFASGGDPTRAFVDSLAAGALAADSGQPVLFSQTSSLSAPTKAYLQAHPIKSVTLVGGTGALSEQIEKDLAAIKVEANRIAGFSRADTARNVDGNIVNSDEAIVIDGLDPNAWVDGFAAAGRTSHLYLSSHDTMPGATAQDLSFADESVGIVCGTTLSALACDRAEDARALDTEFPAVAALIDADATKLGGDGANGFYVSSSGTDICYDAFAYTVEPTATSLHRTADNATVVTMNLEPATDNDPFGCTYGLPAATVADIAANPGDYNIQVDTADGSFKGSLKTLEILGVAALLSEAEVPGPGDPDGAGFAFAFATDTPGELCAGMVIFGFGSKPTGAHIHQASSTQSGPVAVALATPSDGEFSESIGCFNPGEAVVNAIRTNPSGFYFNVHTTEFPNGAARGQMITLG